MLKKNIYYIINVGGIMNRKGFTLIELLAVIVLISIIMIITVPNVVEYVKSSKETSYKILIKNIVTSAQTYYEECEYGNLSELDYEDDKACIINDNSIETTLGTLANLGFLPTKETYENSNKRKVSNPINNQDISECNITITKTKNEVTDSNGIKNNKVTYTITAGKQNNCPTTKEYQK